MQRYRSPLFITATLLIAFGLLTGCDGVTGIDGDDGELGAGEGTMKVLLTDNPFPYDLVDEANVTITSVEARSQSEGNVVLTEEAQSFNLLELRGGVTDLLAEETLPAGTYQQIRLIVSDTASVVLNDGRTFDLKVPSGTETGIKIAMDSLTVEEGKSVELTLDFNVEESFVVQGNISTPASIKGFIFKPVVQSKGHAADDDDDGNAELEGEVESVGANHIVVAGRRFEVASGTELDGFATLTDLSVGTRVKVEFVQDGDDTYRAIEIDLEDGDDGDDGDDDDGSEEREAEGQVSAVGSGYLEVDGTRYEVNAQTTFEEASGLDEISVGTEVEVTYVEATDGSLRALKIELEEEDDGDREEREVKGTVTAVGADYLKVDDVRFEVDERTTFEGVVSLGEISEGTDAEITYVETSEGAGPGSQRALVIEVEYEDAEREVREVTGSIEAVQSASIELNGNRFYIDDHTEFEGGVTGLGGLAEGIAVEIRFVEQDDGTFLAKSIEVESRDDLEGEN